jgi:hypothetical protein
MEHRTTARPTGDYNQVWLDDGLVFERRTSQVIDPPTGLLPALTNEASQRLAAAVRSAQEHPADGPEARSPQERCLTFGPAKVGNLHSHNNSFHQIVQTRDHIVLLSELIHEARIIPLGRTAHVDTRLRLLDGDSRGRWDGTTLVIDTTNFSSLTPFRPKAGMPVTG